MDKERQDFKQLKVLQSLIEVSNIHCSRLETACTYLGPYIPFGAEGISGLSNEKLGFCELLMSRFGKLQDIIGSRIFPLLLEMIDHKREFYGFLDVLNRLEKLELLPSSKEWLDMRELRNHLTHEYPDNPALMAHNLNQAFASGKNLICYWRFLEQKALLLSDQWLAGLGRDIP